MKIKTQSVLAVVQENNERKNTLGAVTCHLCAVRCIIQASRLKYFYVWVWNCLFLKHYTTSEGAVSQNVLYYQQLSIARYQVGFYANNYFEYTPIVSSAFNLCLVGWRERNNHVGNTLISLVNPSQGKILRDVSNTQTWKKTYINDGCQNLLLMMKKLLNK